MKITNFKIRKLHGYKNLNLRFKDNTLILVGENGAVKTTVLRMLFYMLTDYRGVLDNKLPDGWETKLWIANGKDNVLRIHSKLDWRIFKKDQVVFFVDRDLSYFTDEEIPDHSNIYITDKYSIENDVVNRNTCGRVLTELCGFNTMSHGDKETILNLFTDQVNAFFNKMIPIMARIIHWRRTNINACLNDISMKHLFRVKRGKITSIATPKRKRSYIEYMHNQCGVNIDSSYDAAKSEAEFSSNDNHRKFTRGKYLLWFLIKFCLSIHNDCTSMSLSSTEKQPKMKVSLSPSNGMGLIAPRCRVPDSLNIFLRNTVCHYAESKMAA